MPFTLQSSGEKSFVKSQVDSQIKTSYDQAPKDKNRDEDKVRLEKLRDFIFNDLGSGFPDKSPMGLILVGNAGKDYISITRLELSLSMPAKEADLENNPVPVKEQKVEPESMSPPAPKQPSTTEPSTTKGEFK